MFRFSESLLFREQLRTYFERTTSMPFFPSPPLKMAKPSKIMYYNGICLRRKHGLFQLCTLLCNHKSCCALKAERQRHRSRVRCAGSVRAASRCRPPLVSRPAAGRAAEAGAGGGGGAADHAAGAGVGAAATAGTGRRRPPATAVRRRTYGRERGAGDRGELSTAGERDGEGELGTAG